jgi:Tfp pilus assembly protein PilV
MKHLSSRHKAVIRPKTNKTGEEGFAILDALIAAALFGVFMMAVVSMMMHTSHTNRLARDVTEASSLAAGVIERLASLPYDDPNLQNNTVAEPDSEDGRFSFAVTTSLDSIADNTMSIAVTVSWVSQGRTRNVTINDIKVDYI